MEKKSKKEARSGRPAAPKRPRQEKEKEREEDTPVMPAENVAPATSSSPPSAAAPQSRDTTQDKKPYHDPIYRIMHAVPRSDALDVIKCKFGKEHCARAAAYFDASYMQNPLRHLRLQIGCDGPTGLHLFFPRISYHRYALRVLDLSRNRLSSSDVATLCESLALTPITEGEHDTHRVGSSMLASHTTSQLELLDLSYNTQIGSEGALYLLRALRQNTTIRAVQLKYTGITDEGAVELAALLRQRPQPSGRSSSMSLYAQHSRANGFFLNLNENFIGARGTVCLGKGLPDYVSVTLCKQRVPASGK